MRDKSTLRASVTYIMHKEERKAIAHWWRNRGMDRGDLADKVACDEFIGWVVTEAINESLKDMRGWDRR